MISLPNIQPAEKQELRTDGMIDVQECFPTLQGEGPDAGTPAYFIRLAGCTLTCPRCDTNYTSTRKLMSIGGILAFVENNMPPKGMVVITGGEPFRQDITMLVLALMDADCVGKGKPHSQPKVQIETNGTLALPEHGIWTARDLSIVCSPKTGAINPFFERKIRAYKYVIAEGCVDSIDGLPTSALGLGVRPARPLGNYKGPIFLQPEDSGDEVKNLANMNAAIDCCLTYGHKLSSQNHKVWGLR